MVRLAKTNTVITAVPLGLSAYMYMQGDYIASTAFAVIAPIITTHSWLRLRAAELLRRQVDE